MDKRLPDNLRPDLLRRLADGELDAAEQTALEARAAADPAVAAAIESARSFESGLRASVGRVMSEVETPVGLRERVVTAMAMDQSAGLASPATATATTTAASSGQTADPPMVETIPAGGRGGAGPSSMSILRWLNGPRRANAAAVAAVIALVLGAIGFGVLMPPIDEWSGTSTATVAQQAAEFAAREHGRCTDPRATSRKVSGVDTLEKAAAFLESRFNATGIRLPDLSSKGFEFRGISECRVPGGAISTHAIWVAPGGPDGNSGPMVSCFISLDDGAYDLPSGEVTEFTLGNVPVNADSKQTCQRRVLARRDDGLLVMVTCCSDGKLDAVSSSVYDVVAAGR